ncbi:ferredoxin [Candidatus Falkowbacteria bacterium CG10_big_fil_rev_8_21_14_0_10_43_10]|uniref:Ferredoxin n=1 Tax=Candidatus Falkowbacteria bacterium CG10_big_fil_rev_8_21_14_0_10_43_10 TaxID=1974567 RepID=A0A2H0V3B6_9BACT|nr:MAG: ferredoxin [Candidatus Falkowbacteria bacterium CG10_big_fil_rev_8_21_14_0_10_43_10]
MISKVNIKINNKAITAKPKETIAEAAKRNGIDIPLLCSHPDLKIKASCRVCVVKVKGHDNLMPSCSTEIQEGMEIFTDTKEIKRARKTNLELIFAQHREECSDCVWNYNCQLLKLAKQEKIEINRFQDRKSKFPTFLFGNVIEFDSSKCIDCRNCIEMCQKQGVGYLETRSYGHETNVMPVKDKNKDCVYCGQCIMHCPAGAFESTGEFEKIEEPLRQKDKVAAVQFAPSIRSSIGEEFGLQPGEVVTEKLVGALRELGFNKIFDTSVGADFTTMAESAEVIERMESGKNLPILTSCCPAWVRYIEFYYPEFIPNLTTVRSPQIILGGLIKTYWAKINKINPRNIFSVSIMPCVAKKYEAKRPELKVKGMKPIDYVLTTRELARLLMRRKIDFKKIKPQAIDSMFGSPSGAGVIYGASGGVMESALRTTYEKLTGQRLENIEFRQVRGMKEYKEAEIDIKGIKRKAVVINGLGVAQNFLEKIKKGESSPTCVEVMACPGGCIGGGGQPLPSDGEIRKKRAAGLYSVDEKKIIRRAHENPVVQKVYSEFFERNHEMAHKVLHTKYHKQKREKLKIIK